MFQDLLSLGLRIADDQRISLAMAQHHYPMSITQDEFVFVRDHIARRGYRNAYDLATGFGVSACAIGLGVQPRGGHVVSMDCYIEETMGAVIRYHDGPPTMANTADGYAMALALRRHFNLDDVIKFQWGCSPADVPAVLTGMALDFAFIDAAHTDVHLLADVAAIRSYLVRPYTVMLHDTNQFTAAALDEIGSWFGAPLLMPQTTGWFGYALGYYCVE